VKDGDAALKFRGLQYVTTLSCHQQGMCVTGIIYLGTSQMHPGGGYTNIPLSHCEDTPTPSPHCQYNSDHWCGCAILPQCSFLE